MSPSSPLIVPQQANNAKFTTLFKRNIGNVWYQQEAQRPGLQIVRDGINRDIDVQNGLQSIFSHPYSL